MATHVPAPVTQSAAYLLDDGEDGYANTVDEGKK
jgi:hypothetical protein